MAAGAPPGPSTDSKFFCVSVPRLYCFRWSPRGPRGTHLVLLVPSWFRSSTFTANPLGAPKCRGTPHISFRAAQMGVAALRQPRSGGLVQGGME
jgi:hypothetical protein